MSLIDQLKPFLGDIAHLTDESSDGKTTYIHPKLRNLGSVSLVLIREIIAPTVFRNLEAEITDITVGDRRFVRAVPNKFKHRERANGLKLLRHFGAGGSYPQNRHAMPDRDMPSSAFDLNSLVFGDSVNQGNKVLPVKAAALYSDGLSLEEYDRQDLSQSRRRGWNTVRRRQQGQFHQFV
jgi:CRISPR-associated protein Csc2